MVLLGVMPLAAIARVEVEPGVAAAIASSLVFIPGLIGGFIWVVDNNVTHHEWQRDLQRPTLRMWQRAEARTASDRHDRDRRRRQIESLAWDLLKLYRTRMRRHSRSQNWTMIAVLMLQVAILVKYLVTA